MSGGNTLVLLHGWGAHGGVWADVAARLCAGMTLLTPDLAASDNLDDMADRIAAAAPSRCSVAGWSFGGQLALAWARRHPQQVRRLVLIATTPKFVADGSWPQGMALTAFENFAAIAAADAGAALRRFRLLETQGGREARSVARRIGQLLATRALPGPGALLQVLRLLRVTDLRAALPEVAQPVLVIHGDADRVVTPAAGEYLAAKLPQAHLERMAGTAHVPFVSDPDAVGALIGEFCDEP
jgi:pimeloyl-[acyl-carrier protein] methyl ester esterase